MNKFWNVILVLVILVGGLTRVMTLAAAPKKAQDIAWNVLTTTQAPSIQKPLLTAQQDLSTPFFGQNPDELQKSYQDVINQTEAQKRATPSSKPREAASQTKPGAPTTPTTPISPTTTPVSEPATPTTPTTPAYPPGILPPSEGSPGNNEQQDFMRGY